MMTDRWVTGRALRAVASDRAYSGTIPLQVSNGEETSYPYVANYSKGLPHDPDGQVMPQAYRLLLRAVGTGLFDDFERIPLGTPSGRKLVNPQAGLAFDVEGPDSHGLLLPPAPRIDSPQNSSEMAELYWMALARDVKFTDFATDPIVADAAADLTNNFTDFRGPKIGGAVTPETLFRGNTPGDLAGPYVSQFLLKDIPYGTLTVRQLQGTVQPGVDYLTEFPAWLEAQNGAVIPPNRPDQPPRYIQTPRDLATYVHFDALYEAYLNACLILLGMGAPFDAGNPYNFSQNQEGFGTYGGPHILSLVPEVATRALKAVWFQKWFVHRRLRPEEFGGRIEAQRLGLAQFPMINSEILDSPVLDDVLDAFGSHLLPQAFTEGCPTHPAYGSGHATVAGACVTILKAWFDESFVIPNPVVPNADGTGLVPAPGNPVLTVGGELNKVAANIGNARSMAGVHWRTDFTEPVRLGEEIAIGILADQKPTTNESASFTITRFDGTTITI
jgi:membrane-associated phospholipid phosphatase